MTSLSRVVLILPISLVNLSSREMSGFSLVVRGYVRSRIDYVVDTVPIIGLDYGMVLLWLKCTPLDLGAWSLL